MWLHLGSLQYNEAVSSALVTRLPKDLEDGVRLPFPQWPWVITCAAPILGRMNTLVPPILMFIRGFPGVDPQPYPLPRISENVFRFEVPLPPQNPPYPGPKFQRRHKQTEVPLKIQRPLSKLFQHPVRGSYTPLRPAGAQYLGHCSSSAGCLGLSGQPATLAAMGLPHNNTPWGVA